MMTSHLTTVKKQGFMFYGHKVEVLHSSLQVDEGISSKNNDFLTQDDVTKGDIPLSKRSAVNIDRKKVELY